MKIAKAAAPSSSPITLKCSPSASAGNSDANGNTFAQINCTWSTNFREDTVDTDSYDWLVSVYNNTDKVYFGIWKDTDMKFNGGNQNNLFYGDTGNPGGIGWNKSYTITVKLHNRKTNKITSTAVTNPPINTGDMQKLGKSNGSGACSVAPVFWTPYSNTNNNIRITWTVPKDPPCSAGYITIQRPVSKSFIREVQFNNNNKIGNGNVADGAAESGTYILQPTDINGNSIGTPTTLTVDLSESSLTNGLKNDNTAGKGECLKSCESTVLGMRWLGSVTSPFKQAMCNAQCFMIDLLSNMMSTVIHNVLFRSLGIKD
jgi:hypothetical protein